MRVSSLACPSAFLLTLSRAVATSVPCFVGVWNMHSGIAV